jgi:Mn2+/Fe2+ NRAMP family transporter
MGAVMQLMTGIRAAVWTPLFAVLIVSLLIWCSYRYLARVFKWLTLALFSYVIAAFFAHPKWGDVLRATFIPRLASDQNYLATFVGIMGTTISPYLFFWQAAEEVEEERAHGQRTLRSRRGATRQELSSARNDVLAGMLLSNVVMYFIILTAGATLHQAGITHLETAGEAARALRPLAGDTAYLLFTLGLIGTGMLGVPVLAGSAAYAVAEAMHWRGSLDDRPSVAPQFYAVLVVSVFLGLGLDFLKINAVQALFWAAIVNGVLAPPLVVLVTLVTSDPRVMGEHVNPLPLRVLGWFTALVMGAAAVGLVVTARG